MKDVFIKSTYFCEGCVYKIDRISGQDVFIKSTVFL